MKNMIKFNTFLLYLLCVTATFGQKPQPYDVQKIKITEHKYMLTVKEKDVLRYTGNFGTPWSLPIGTHFLFNDTGSVHKIIEFELSPERFEGVPMTVQTVYEFKDNVVVSITSAMRCTECEFVPIGMWKYFDSKGVLIREIDTQTEGNQHLEHPYYEDFWKFLEN